MVGRRKAFREEMRHFQPLVVPESMPDFMEQGQGDLGSYRILKSDVFGDHVISFELVIPYAFSHNLIELAILKNSPYLRPKSAVSPFLFMA